MNRLPEPGAIEETIKRLDSLVKLGYVRNRDGLYYATSSGQTAFFKSLAMHFERLHGCPPRDAIEAYNAFELEVGKAYGNLVTALVWCYHWDN